MTISVSYLEALDKICLRGRGLLDPDALARSHGKGNPCLSSLLFPLLCKPAVGVPFLGVGKGLFIQVDSIVLDADNGLDYVSEGSISMGDISYPFWDCNVRNYRVLDCCSRQCCNNGRVPPQCFVDDCLKQR
jgi:hypothetical protein